MTLSACRLSPVAGDRPVEVYKEASRALLNLIAAVQAADEAEAAAEAVDAVDEATLAEYADQVWEQASDDAFTRHFE
eukprot:SAG22_NODE_15124_length_356_cov_0.914397_2_plen_76_part_01